MSDDDLLDPGITGCFHHNECFLRRHVGGSQGDVVVADKREYILQLRDNLPVTDQFDAVGRILAHFQQMLFCGLSRKPDHLSTQLKALFNRFRIYAADHLVHHYAAIHRKAGIIAVHPADEFVGHGRAVYSEAKVRFDDDRAGSDTDAGFRKLEIIVSP